MSGCVIINGGTLNLTINNEMMKEEKEEIVIIESNSNCLKGKFMKVNVKIENGNGKHCSIQTQQKQTDEKLSVLISTSSCDDSKRKMMIIIGSVIGCVVIFVIIIIIIGYVCRRRIATVVWRERDEGRTGRIIRGRSEEYANMREQL